MQCTINHYCLDADNFTGSLPSFALRCHCVCAWGARYLVLPQLLWKLYWIPPSPKGKRFKCLCNYTSNNSAVHLGQANDKELQVSQSIEGLLISVTCLSRWVGQQQRCLLTYVCVPAPLMNSVRASVFICEGGVCLRTGGENFTRSRGTCIRLKSSDREMRRDGRECRRLLVATVCNLLWPYTLSSMTSPVSCSWHRLHIVKMCPETLIHYIICKLG